MSDYNSLRIAVVHWRKEDGIASAIVTTLGDIGCKRVLSFHYQESVPKNVDVVFAYGPFRSLVPVVNQLSSLPSSQQSVFVLWMTEQFPNPNLPHWFWYAFGNLRSYAERLAYRRNSHGEWYTHPWLHWLTTKAHRFRYYGDLYWFRRQKFPFVLGIGSRWIYDYLQAKGIDAVLAYYAYFPEWGKDLEMVRDIPVLWLGKMATNRRRKVLQKIRTELMVRNIDVLMIDGVENPYVYGESRTVLLNRTKIVLNVLRTEWDNHSLRYYLAASNKSLIVTEPTLPHTPFIPGVHLIEVPVEKIADTIAHYIEHEQERQRIVTQAYQLVTTELTMKNGVSRLLEEVLTVRSDGRNSR